MHPAQERPFVSIVIPVFNGEAGLRLLIDDLIVRLSSFYRLQIILVNDASTDRSEEVCVALYEKYPGIVQVISLAENAGEYNAVMAGLKQVRSDCAVIMDDDGQNPPSQVPVLLEAALSGRYDAVYSAYKRKQHPFWRNLASGFYNAAACLLLKKPAGLYLSSFKAVNRPVLEAIIRDGSSAPSLDAVILRATRRIGQVTVDHLPRQTGRSGYSFPKLFALGLRLIAGHVPLRSRKERRPPFVVRRSWGIETDGR